MNAGSSKDVRDDHAQFHVRHAWTVLHSSNISMPWERNLQSVLRDGLFQTHKRFKVAGNLGPAGGGQVEQKELQAIVKDRVADAGIRLSKATGEGFWELKLSADRKAACKKWSALATSNAMVWRVSRPKPGQEVMDVIREGVAESIKDCLGVKATSALHARAGPLIRYAQYAKENGNEAFPVREHVAYSFLKQGSFAASFPKSFITSVAFAKRVLGLQEADEVLESGRIKGFAAIHFCKRKRRDHH